MYQPFTCNHQFEAQFMANKRKLKVCRSKVYSRTYSQSRKMLVNGTCIFAFYVYDELFGGRHKMFAVI